MRSPAIPATYFTACPTCGATVSAAIAPEDRRCPDDRGTITFTLAADTTRLIDAVTPPRAGSAADWANRAARLLGMELEPWQQQVLAQLATGGTVSLTLPRRSEQKRAAAAYELALAERARHAYYTAPLHAHQEPTDA